MKRVISFIAAMALLVICLPLGTLTRAATQEVTLSEGDSLADALKNVADGGTIKVEGTVAVTANPGTHNKTVTITGGELDFSGHSSNVSLGDHITFENITLTFATGRSPAQAIYANGYKVKMGEGITMNTAIRIFGGKSGGTTASTNLTVLSGYYAQIWGGGNNTNITGDVNLYVGGKTNADLADPFSHSATCCVYGGNYIPEGSSNTIGGTVRTVFTGNAEANYIYGGNGGTGTGIITGGTDLTVSGGSVMSVYGGGTSGSYTGDVKLLISGGTMQQVFGGSSSGAVTGDVAVDITGGTITRRVYGGCYNNYDGSWSSDCHVAGNIVLTLHSGANIDFSSSDSDRSIYAHSRQKTLSSTEVTHLVYADSTAYSNYKNKVKAQDFTMSLIMGSTSAADHIHYHTYTASGAVITQKCETGGCSSNATATVAVEGTPAYVGTPVEPAKVIYSGDWFGGELDVAYANNNGVGTGTASITCGGATAAVDFPITTPNMTMNGEGYGSLEEAVAAARKTAGADTITLQKDVEVSTWLVINTDVTITADKAVTITGADSQTGSMFRVIGGGKLTIQGASEEAKITLKAGVNTTNVVVNNGGDIFLTNVKLIGNENTVHTETNKARGIFNDDGNITAKNVEIADMVKGDSIYVLDGTTVNLDNVTITNSGRYGIKVKGTVNIYNTVHPEHALSISNTGDNAIDIEKGGELSSDLSGVSADVYAIRISESTGKGINVRHGGNAELSNVSVTDSGNYGIYFSNSADIGSSGSITNFYVSKAGRSAVYIEDHCTAALTKGTITSDGLCVTVENKGTLSVSDVTVQTGGDIATIILGTLNGELTKIEN